MDRDNSVQVLNNALKGKFKTKRKPEAKNSAAVKWILMKVKLVFPP